MRQLKSILILTIVFFSSLQAQQILGKMVLEDISDSQEMRTTIIRNPERALLIVTSQIPSLTFETNNEIFSVEERTPGTWHIILTPGTHRLTIRADGFVSLAKRMFFKSKEVKAFQVDILGSGDRSTGSEALALLDLKMVPDDAEVYINDQLVDLSAEENRRLPASTYRIRVQKKDYEPYENLIRLTAGQTRSLYVVLQRSKSVTKAPVQPEVIEEDKSSRKVWLFVAGGGVVAAGAAAYLLLSGSPDEGGNGPGVTPGIPDPVFPGND